MTRLVRVLLAGLTLTLLGCTVLAQEAPAPPTPQPQPTADAIDWNRARELYQRFQRGEKLTPEEQAYLDRARAARQVQQGGARAAQGNADLQRARELMAKRNSGQPLTDEERAFLEKMRAQIQGGAGGQAVPPPPPARASTGLIPLDQMTADERYKGEDGGLYGGGQNEPPAELQQAAEAVAKAIVPLDAEGKPSATGKIVLMSIGMSNTTQEFSKFKELAEADGDKSPLVILVDAAQGGKEGTWWKDDQARPEPWRVAEERLKAAGVTPQQVQVIWLKQALAGPARYGEFPSHSDELKRDIVLCLNIAKRRYPNLRLVFLSSRIYGGYATTSLNPEPYAYEGAFTMRGLILDQMKGDPQLNWDPAKGKVKAPLLLWGPYLWADGVTPRKSDGLTWGREDFGADGTHPSLAGREKVARMLLQFLKTNPYAKGWFTKPAPPPTQP